MARPVRKKGDTPTDQKILEAATSSFARHGFADANLKAIAAEVGIRRPSLLYHFESKEVLYEAVVTRTFEQLADAIALPMQASGDFQARLRALVEGFESYVDGNEDVAGILVRELIAPESPGQTILLERGLALLQLVEDWVNDAGTDALREGVDVRRALLQVVSDTLLRNASAKALRPLWGDRENAAWELIAATLLEER